ncbi:MAG: SulP family inorganic anion transporter [Acidimicrobiia bacterium]|nr:SulP family inorganic anion transporter [Acidimicrobiia bacterium]
MSTLRLYEPSSARYDVIAGLVLATMLIPQGMAYAELTGLPAVTGIYTTIAALIAYSVFGPNRQLVLGPDSSLAPVIAAVILPLAAGDAAASVALASALSILAGLICIAAGYLRVGVITELLSKPIRVGYLNGIAVIVLISQLPKALGFSVQSDSTIEVLADTLGMISDGATVGWSLALAAASVIIIVGLRQLSQAIPGVVLAAGASIAAVAVFDLTDLGVQVVGDIATGLPSLTLPGIGVDVLPNLIGGALIVALVSFADTGSLSTTTALKSGTRVDPNSEIKALGAANIVSGLFQGFPTSASSSRTAVAMAVGARTQVTGLVAAAGVILVMVATPFLVTDMPSPTLAAIVITASMSLFDWPTTYWLYRARTSEFMLLLGAFLGVLLLGILEGIGFAILLSLLNFVRKALRPHATELGKVAGVPGYHDLERHPEAALVPGLLLIRFDAPLFFANAPTFGRKVQEMLSLTGRPIRRVVVVANAITDIDTTGAEILSDVLDDLTTKGISFAFAGLKGPIKDRLRTYGLYGRLGDEGFFPNTISAVKSHTEEQGETDDEPGPVSD